MPSSTGRRIVLPLTNKSGGGVIAGDVVIIDTGNDEAFTTTTSAAHTGGVGIVQETIASNGIGRVLVHGYAALVNVNASVTRGYYGATHTTVKQAAASASRGAGSFCQFLTGGATPTARVFAPDLAAAAGNVATDAIWDAAGDLAVGSGPDTAAVLTKGSDLDVLTISASTHVPVWAAPGGGAFPQVSRVTRADTDVTTTSTSFADVTGMTTTITTGAHRCLIYFNANGKYSNADDNMFVTIDIDGTNVGNSTYGLVFTNSTIPIPISMFYLSDVLSAASHTIKIRFRSGNAGYTGTIYSNVTPAILTVIETNQTT